MRPLFRTLLDKLANLADDVLGFKGTENMILTNKLTTLLTAMTTDGHPLCSRVKEIRGRCLN